MDESEFARVRSLFLRASELSQSQRVAFLDSELDQGDPIRRQVEHQLRYVDDPSLVLGDIADLDEFAEDRDPKFLGAYEVIERIAAGGMGVVYEALQKQPIERRVAIKLLKAGLATGSVMTRFEAERQALAIMDHPAVAKVFDAGLDSRGRPYFVMELVDGVSITGYSRRFRLTRVARLRLFVQVCAAVQHAHQKGVIHRDLKPSNVLVTVVDGIPTCKLIDFGIAKATEHKLLGATLQTQIGTVMGTPDYMSPEQADPSVLDVDVRTDVYSLGVVLYELLCDRLPFPMEELRTGGLEAMLRLLREHDPLPPAALDRTLRGDLTWITMRAIAKERDDRYSSAAALAEDVEHYLCNRPVSVGPPDGIYLLKKFVRRHRAFVVATGTVATALVIFLIVAVWTIFATNTARERELTAIEEELHAADPLRVAGLLQRAGEAWPRVGTLEENRSWIAAWQSEVRDVLARQSRQASEQPRSAVDAQQIQRLREVASGVASRIALIERHWPLWSACRTSLANESRFAAIDFKPMRGLVPLGIDTDRNTELGDPFAPLWAFAAPGTGAIPRRVDGHGRDVPLGAPGRVVFADDTALVLLLVPGGRFFRGAQNTDPAAPGYQDTDRLGRNDSYEWPVMEARVPPFLIGKCPVTNAQFLRYLAARDLTKGAAAVTPVSEIASAGDRTGMRRFPPQPVTTDWHGARAFCRWLGLELPSETNWECASRAGTTGRYWTGSDVEASSRAGRSGAKNRPHTKYDIASYRYRGQPTPNPWGIYGILCSKKEWCEDAWRARYDGSALDGRPALEQPAGSARMGHRIMRGNTTTSRHGKSPGVRLSIIVFRVSKRLQ